MRYVRSTKRESLFVALHHSTALTLFRPANVAEEVVLHAFGTGYRHVRGQDSSGKASLITVIQVDSARAYRNERPCADAIRKSGIPRSDIFFTTKVPPRSMGYEQTKASIESSFKQTGLDYIDLSVETNLYYMWRQE